MKGEAGLAGETSAKVASSIFSRVAGLIIRSASRLKGHYIFCKPIFLIHKPVY
jgi:hypothetical protein